MKLSQKDVSRFWSKVDVQGPDDCWLWKAGKTKFGHGVFSVKHQWVLAHRISFLIEHGYLPDLTKGRMVVHDCERPGCQNPEHLLEGSNKQNQCYPSCLAKHRSRQGPNSPMYGRRGENSPRWGTKHSAEAKAKMQASAIARGGWHKGLRRSTCTKARISEVTRGENNGSALLDDNKVREILKSTEKNITLAKLYGVDPSIISGVRRRVRWKHVKL